MKCDICGKDTAILSTNGNELWCNSCLDFELITKTPTPTSPTPRTDADMIRIQCISLQVLANNRLEHGDKTVHDDIIGAIVTIHQLETSLIKAQQENERLGEELKEARREADSQTEIADAMTYYAGKEADVIKQLTQLHEIAKGLADVVSLMFNEKSDCVNLNPDKTILGYSFQYRSKIHEMFQSALTAYEDFVKENK